MTEKDEKILKSAVYYYGVESQVNQLVEECGEFIACLNHVKRGRKNIVDLIGEMVDIEIVLDQMRLVYGGYDWTKARAEKIERLGKITGGME